MLEPRKMHEQHMRLWWRLVGWELAATRSTSRRKLRLWSQTFWMGSRRYFNAMWFVALLWRILKIVFFSSNLLQKRLNISLTGFQGASCEKLYCPGTPLMCSGRGTCARINNQSLCVCNAGFGGLDCSELICPGTPYCNLRGELSLKDSFSL